MPRHRVDLGLRGMRYSVDGEVIDATGFPLWERNLPRGLHLERRASGPRNDNRHFVRTPGHGVSVEWTSNRDTRDAAARRDQGPPPRRPRGPPPGHQRGPPPGHQQGPPPGHQQGPPPGHQQGPPPGHQQGPPPEDMRAHHARQRREQHPGWRRGEQRGQGRRPGAEEAGLFDVSEHDSDDDEHGDEGSRASIRRDNYDLADYPRWHDYRFESEQATWASDPECDYSHGSAHDARSRARPRREDRRTSQDPHWLGFRVQLGQPSRRRGH